MRWHGLSAQLSSLQVDLRVLHRHRSSHGARRSARGERSLQPPICEQDTTRSEHADDDARRPWPAADPSCCDGMRPCAGNGATYRVRVTRRPELDSACDNAGTLMAQANPASARTRPRPTKARQILHDSDGARPAADEASSRATSARWPRWRRRARRWTRLLRRCATPWSRTSAPHAARRQRDCAVSPAGSRCRRRSTFAALDVRRADARRRPWLERPTRERCEGGSDAGPLPTPEALARRSCAAR